MVSRSSRRSGKARISGCSVTATPPADQNRLMRSSHHARQLDIPVNPVDND
jgi:hypothetical protein